MDEKDQGPPDQQVVWIVESGDYDSYSVDAIYATEDAARSHCEQMNKHSAIGSAEYSYHPWVVETEAPTIHWVYVRTDMPGDVSRASHTMLQAPEVNVNRYPGKPGSLSLVVTGPSMEAVDEAFEAALASGSE